MPAPPTYATLVAALPPRPRLDRTALVPERAREFPPAPPPGCTLSPPVRTLAVPASGPVLFATAAATGRALLAVALPEGRGDAGTEGDAATWILEPGTGEPRWLRGPIEPVAPAVVAASAGATMVLTWTRPGADERDDGSLRVAAFAPGADAPMVTALATGPEPLATDLACAPSRCTVALAWRDRYADPSQADRAAFPALELPALRWHDAAPRDALPAAHAANALADGPPAGTVVREGTPHLVRRDRAAPVPLDPAVLDLARVGDALYAVLARAPASTPCQPGAWQLSLARLAPDGTLAAETALATTDARPRGARIRAVGSPPTPLVTWLDAPQCAERFFVIRAWRDGRVAAMAQAEEYDLATDGLSVSLVLRLGERLRWMGAQCL